MASTSPAGAATATGAEAGPSAPSDRTSPANGNPGDARAARDRQAKDAFRSLHFYAGGHGMHMSPDLISVYDFSIGTNPPQAVQRWLNRRWGLVYDGGRPAGLFEVPDRDMKIGVVGCVVCHSGRAAGQFVVGLGNKNIDVVRLAKDLNRLERWWQRLGREEKRKSEAYRQVEEAALSFSAYLGNDRIGNLTQGLVPVSFIRGWFYRVQGEDLPQGLTRGQVKVPALWGYELKRKVGQFCDGYGNGEKAGWAVAVELAAGQKPETVREYYHKVEEAELLFNDFLPPRYPFAIDAALADQGQKVFLRSCAGCHGTYVKDGNGHPYFQTPKHIPWDVVKTDPDRINGNTPAFQHQVSRSPLADLIQTTGLPPGFFAPRLEGVWSRFPFLHNGSIPNIAVLLTPPSARPKVFSLRDAGEKERFDPDRLGLTIATGTEAARLTKAGRAGDRDVYDTSRVGHSNQGHDFHTDMPAVDKRALIEYLKTL